MLEPLVRGCHRKRDLAVAALAALAILVPVRPGAACPPSPPAYWTLTGTLPPAGQLVPTDGVFLLTGIPWADRPFQEYHPSLSGELAHAATASVRDAAGRPVAGALEPWYGGEVPTALWRPAEPLPPNATFTFQASFSHPYVTRPAAAVGETSQRATFSTGVGSGPPLRVAGDLRVSFESYDQPLYKDCDICGGGCKPDGTVRAVRARLTIPEVSGGYPDGGYGAWVWMTQGQPFSPPAGRPSFVGGGDGPGGFERLTTGSPTDLLWPVSDLDPVCYSARVYDPADRYIDLTPVCLPRRTLSEIDRPAAPAARGEPDAATGCAISAARARAHPALLSSALVGIGLLARRRRRRGR